MARRQLDTTVSSYYDNSFLIADAKEAYILEIRPPLGRKAGQAAGYLKPPFDPKEHTLPRGGRGLDFAKS